MNRIIRDPKTGLVTVVDDEPILHADSGVVDPDEAGSIDLDEGHVDDSTD